MPTYGKDNFKETNVNYLNKDFSSLRQSLMDYAKSYFPDTYRDFNETSPGMMLLEMNAYVGDVLSFYIDQQYREMLLPLAEERRNVLNIAKMFGYKVKPICASYVDLTFFANVEASSGNIENVDYSTAGTWDPGIEFTSDINPNVKFTTLEHIDFTISQSSDTDNIGSLDTAGLISTYNLSRTVKAISATEKTLKIKIGAPEKFKKITIPDTNVVDIVSCVDSNGQSWYEVDFLAQDKVPIKTHYTDDASRDSAYQSADGLISEVAVPFSLTYITTTKRFTRETNEDNTTSLVFGNGVLKDGQMVDDGYIDMEQVGIVIPGQTNDLNDSIDPLLGNEYSTLGETPNQTTLTITYRVGGGFESNLPAGSLSAVPTLSAQNGNTAAVFSGMNQEESARGGKNEESTIEIKEKAKAFFMTQNRCVTKEDYEARILNMSADLGSIAKVYVTRNETPTGELTAEAQQLINIMDGYINNAEQALVDIEQANNVNNPTELVHEIIESISQSTILMMDLKNLIETGFNPAAFGDMVGQFMVNANSFFTKVSDSKTLIQNHYNNVETFLSDLEQSFVANYNDAQAALEAAYTTFLNSRAMIQDNQGISSLNDALQTHSQLEYDHDTSIEIINQLEVLSVFHTNLFIKINNLQNSMNNFPHPLSNLVNGYNAVAQTLVVYLSLLSEDRPDFSVLTENTFVLSPINVYALGYNNRKQLVGNPHSTELGGFASDGLPNTLLNNIKTYLDNFRIMTDSIILNDGYIVNFGVFFDIIAEKYADKQEVKLKCIQVIKDYFNIDKMQFNQPIYKSQLEYELMGVEGVLSLGHLTLTQQYDHFYHQGEGNGQSLADPTYTYSFSDAGEGADLDGDGSSDGSFIISPDGTTGYGYKYDFQIATSDDGSVILPPNTATPTVFELKNPNKNIQGRVR